MNRDLGSSVLPCQRHTATLVVEVERRDGRPLSAPATVRLHGAEERAATISGAPARASFEALDPGAYTVDVELGGEEVEYGPVPDEPASVTLAANASTAVRIEVEGDDAELVTADFAHLEDVVETTDGPDDADDEDEWEVTEASLDDTPDDLTEAP